MVAALDAAPKLPATLPSPIELTLKTPALIVVAPVYELTPTMVSVPAPILVRPPVVVGMAPEMVRLLAVISKVEMVPAPRVKLLLVDAVDPVYCSVPPFRTRLVAALPAAPRLPGTLPSPMVATLNTPALMVVTPV